LFYFLFFFSGAREGAGRHGGDEGVEEQREEESAGKEPARGKDAPFGRELRGDHLSQVSV